MSELVLESGRTRLVVDPDDGGRVTSARVDGLEVLGGVDARVANHGCFVMAPWAGRIRHGRFRYEGSQRQLPQAVPPHALHGVVHDRPWRVRSADPAQAVLACDFDERWPFGGRAVQGIAVSDNVVVFTLVAEAGDRSYPASMGWHPWFRRRLDRGGSAVLELRAGSMLPKDSEGIATPERVPVRPGPWDDCFDDVTWPARLRWPGALALAVWSDARYAVVFDERVEALCVEPQTGPPDALNIEPRLVTPAHPLHATMRWTFTSG